MDPAPADCTALETSPHLPNFKLPCYIKKQHEGTTAFIIPTIGRKNSTNGSLRGTPAGTRIGQCCHK